MIRSIVIKCMLNGKLIISVMLCYYQAVLVNVYVLRLNTSIQHGKMWIYLACLFIPDSWSVAMCEDSIVLPSGSLTFISFDIITGDIVVVDCFARFIFVPKSALSSMLLLVGMEFLNKGEQQ